MYDYLRHCLVSLQNPVELLDRFVEERGEVGHQSGVSRTCERTSQDLAVTTYFAMESPGRAEDLRLVSKVTKGIMEETEKLLSHHGTPLCCGLESISSTVYSALYSLTLPYLPAQDFIVQCKYYDIR